ncbi:MAG: family 78 glycoside hydrolase catalytic domain [Clostridia bacterium]|nr:family 78 glycoside hydrolase catalytic domain [Clostridia bacterium]
MTFKGKFITLAEFAYLPPIDVFHREGEDDREKYRELDKNIKAAHPDGLKNLHILFRRSFTLAAGTCCRVYMNLTADDYYKLYINGSFAAQGPAQDYPFAYNWNRVDITNLLRDGENEIFVEVYYMGLINRAYDSGDLRCGLIADVIGETREGEVCLLSTDESWQCAVDKSYTGMRTTGYETQYLEDRDLRIQPTEWERVRVRNHDYTFHGEPVPTLDVHTIEPVTMLTRTVTEEEKERVSLVADFGHATTGGLRLVIKGHAGDVIELRAAEELAPDADGKQPKEGELTSDTAIRWKSRANCAYSEFVTLDEGENLLDQYDYKIFRYAEVLYEDADIEVISFTAVERHWSFDEEACQLESSDKVLEQVFDICKRGVKLGSQEVYVDCPGREKGQYAGDLTVTSASQLWLTGDTRLFVKAVRNQLESAFIDEGIMAVTPGSYMQEIADYSLQLPILALRYYDFTGDADGLRDLLVACDKMLTYFERYQREDGLLDGVSCKWNLVDWPENLRDGYDFPKVRPITKGVHNVINAFYIGAVICTEKIIDILGIPLEEGARRSEALIEAFNRCFWRPELGLYADNETTSHCALHSNILPAFYGFARTEARQPIIELIRSKGLVCGVYMSYFLLKALCNLGMYTDAYRLITSQAENSWYNMVREGGTTCFEAWGKDKKWNTSLCHPWASAPISVLIEDILGISPKLPGFAEVDVRPHIPSTVEKLEMRIPLPTDRHIEFEWERGFYNYRILKNEG